MYWATGVFGLALLIAPLILNYAGNVFAFWTSVIVGAGVVILSILERTVKGSDSREYWALGFLGIVAMASPFLFGFTSHAAAMWTSITGGVLIALSAGSRLYQGGFRK